MRLLSARRNINRLTGASIRGCASRFAISVLDPTEVRPITFHFDVQRPRRSLDPLGYQTRTYVTFVTARLLDFARILAKIFRFSRFQRDREIQRKIGNKLTLNLYDCREARARAFVFPSIDISNGYRRKILFRIIESHTCQVIVDPRGGYRKLYLWPFDDNFTNVKRRRNILWNA